MLTTFFWRRSQAPRWVQRQKRSQLGFSPRPLSPAGTQPLTDKSWEHKSSAAIVPQAASPRIPFNIFSSLCKKKFWQIFFFVFHFQACFLASVLYYGQSDLLTSLYSASSLYLTSHHGSPDTLRVILFPGLHSTLGSWSNVWHKSAPSAGY